MTYYPHGAIIKVQRKDDTLCSPKRKPGVGYTPGFHCAAAGLLAVQPLADNVNNYTSYDGKDKGNKIIHCVHLPSAEVSGNRHNTTIDYQSQQQKTNTRRSGSARGDISWLRERMKLRG